MERCCVSVTGCYKYFLASSYSFVTKRPQKKIFSKPYGPDELSTPNNFNRFHYFRY